VDKDKPATEPFLEKQKVKRDESTLLIIKTLELFTLSSEPDLES
jgi:hypothetical protein